MQSTTERRVSFLLSMRHSKMTLKIGWVKQMTTRSPMGINGKADITEKLDTATNRP